MKLQSANAGQSHCISIANIELHLRSDATLWIPEFKALIAADLHLGKESSFRSAGIPVPQGPTSKVLQRLKAAVCETQCENLFVLGDMFHNRQSIDSGLIDELQRWLLELQPAKVTLILGNHDRCIHTFPECWELSIVDSVKLTPFDLVHDPKQKNVQQPHLITIGGHIHPVVKVGRIDSMRMKCFAFYADRIVLPACGQFTGGHLVSCKQMHHCFVFDDQHIWKI